MERQREVKEVGGGRGARQEGREGGREARRERERVQAHRGVGGTECSERERGEGEVKDRGSDHEEEAEEEGRREEGGGGREEGGRERSALARWFPTKQVRLHISPDCIVRTLFLI